MTTQLDIDHPWPGPDSFRTQDAAFFRAIFKRSVGMTPSEYRESFVEMTRVRDGAIANGERHRANELAGLRELQQASAQRR